MPRTRSPHAGASPRGRLDVCCASHVLEVERVVAVVARARVFEPRPAAEAEAAAGEGDLDLLDLEELVARQAAQAGALSPLMWRGGGGAGRWSGPPPRTVEAEETNEQSRIS